MNTIWDQHLHCNFSGDSEEAPEAVIEAAKAAKLPGITFTDHLDWDYREEPGRFDLDFNRYVPTIRKLSQVHSTDFFSIRCGVELGLQEHLAVRHSHFVSAMHFDIVIGSVHVVEGRDPYFDSFYENRTIPGAYRDYFNAVLRNVRAFSDFDVLGHLDYVKRYVLRLFGEEKGKLIEFDYGEVLTEILREIIRKDIALEVNTGSLRYGLSDTNPSAVILKRYKELGGHLITIGSDAHEAKHVANGFSKLPNMLSECGFDSYVIFRERVPEVRSFW